MHQILSLPFDAPNDEISLIEQQCAPILFLTSASSDISILSNIISKTRYSRYSNQIRALTLDKLAHPAQIDHYLSTTGSKAQIIIIRLLGGRGHWSYGLQQLQIWKEQYASRKLIILAGTTDEFNELHSLSSINIDIVEKLARLLINGGNENIITFMNYVFKLLKNKDFNSLDIPLRKIDDPYLWDWREDQAGSKKVGLIYYKSLYLSSDLALPLYINNALRKKNISPRVVFVSSLRDSNLINNVINIFAGEGLDAIITTTSFTSGKSDSINQNVFDHLNIPIVQLILSSDSYNNWFQSSRGLCSLDLSLQVVLPEIDGRITTKPCAFKENSEANKALETTIQNYIPYKPNISYSLNYVRKIIELKYKDNHEKKITIILANYPIKNGRIANGVGLDTPTSLANILQWLYDDGYYLGQNFLNPTGNQIIDNLLSHRTNDPESKYKEPLDFVSLDVYLEWWTKLSPLIKETIINKWDIPQKANDLELKGFPVLGIKYGNISILIQPSRAFEYLTSSEIHSPELPPPHSYLAQYLWINLINQSQAIINLGKHGTLEWLPGKGVGLSETCNPTLCLDSIPTIYPFIVNDPGEGSQAKRRTHSIIIDHLTPPLDRSCLYGDMQKLEGLIDEYYESYLFNSERTKILEDNIKDIALKLNLSKYTANSSNNTINKSLVTDLDSYLCEIKQSQIRTGLHIFGERPNNDNLLNLLLCILRSPSNSYLGITQILAFQLGLELNPWIDIGHELISEKDNIIFSPILNQKQIRVRHVIDWLENQAKIFLNYYIIKAKTNSSSLNIYNSQLKSWAISSEGVRYIEYINKVVWNRLTISSIKEKESLLSSLCGSRIEPGASGAPTRGRPEVLPTGRNFYSLDLRGLPTEAAWDLGRRSAENILELYKQENGQHLTHLALSVWGTATMRNGGEDICQLLALIGVRPIWDGPTRRFVDLALIPVNVLGRPRVDVTLRISGLFRDSFPNLINCVYRAQSLVRTLNEPKDLNPFAASVREGGSINRIYGSAPSAYGAGIQNLIDSGAWETRGDLADAYISWSKWTYNQHAEPIEDKKGFKECLSKVKVVMHNQDNREHDILDSDDYYQFHGGLTSAVERVSGIKPEVYIGDNSNILNPKVHHLSREIDKVVRSRVLNPKWINGMKEHGYKGAFEMGATLDYLFSYDSTTGEVPEWCYSQICDSWLLNHDTVKFLLSNNPWVLRDIAERFLEAKNRGLWTNINSEQNELLRKLILQSEKEIETNI